MSPLLCCLRKYINSLMLLSSPRFIAQRIFSIVSLSFKFYLFILHPPTPICDAHIFLDVCPSTWMWSVVDLSESILLEKTDCPSPSSNQFLSSLTRGAALCSPPIFMVEFGLTLGLVHAVITTLANTSSCFTVSRKLNCLVVICLWLLNSSSSVSAMIPKP